MPVGYVTQNYFTQIQKILEISNPQKIESFHLSVWLDPFLIVNRGLIQESLGEKLQLKSYNKESLLFLVR